METAGISCKRGGVDIGEGGCYGKLKRPRLPAIRVFPKGCDNGDAPMVFVKVELSKDSTEGGLYMVSETQKPLEARETPTLVSPENFQNCGTDLASGAAESPRIPELLGSESLGTLKAMGTPRHGNVEELKDFPNGGLQLSCPGKESPDMSDFLTTSTPDAEELSMYFQGSCHDFPPVLNKLPNMLEASTLKPLNQPEALEVWKTNNVKLLTGSSEELGQLSLQIEEPSNGFESSQSEYMGLLETFESNQELLEGFPENYSLLPLEINLVPHALENSKPKITEIIDFLERPNPEELSTSLDESGLTVMQIVVGQGEPSICESAGELIFRGSDESIVSLETAKFDILEQPKRFDELKLIDMPIFESKNQALDANKDEVCKDLSEFWSNLSNTLHEPSNALTQIQESISDPKALEEQAPRSRTRRRISAVRSFPFGCGQNIPQIKKEDANRVASKVQDRAQPRSESDRSKAKAISKVCLQKESENMKLLSTITDTKSPSRKATGHLWGSDSKLNMLRNSDCQNKSKKTLGNVKRSSSVKENYPGCTSNLGSEHKSTAIREKVRDTLRLFQTLCRKFLQEEESMTKVNGKLNLDGPKTKVSGKHNRVDFKAFKLLKKKGMWLAAGNQWLGSVPGIEVGDEFHYRVELCLTGLHRCPMAGIDSMKVNGRSVATCVVSSGGYSDIMDSSDILIYEGQGGHPDYQRRTKKPPGDQKLERGNLALKNSIDAKTPLRVIHGFREQKGSDLHGGKVRSLATYVYDGLYLVERCWSEIGNKGFSVFKFRLRRMPGQPLLALKEVRMLKQMKVRQGLCMDDISHGKEKRAIGAVNTIDNELPAPFRYMTRMIYPSWYKPIPPKGCNCTGGCSNSTCACAAKNGGEFPFNYDGAIVRAKPLVYECGPSCKCPPSCYNRVSQRGIKYQLEIFKTKSRGWGVRSLTSIPSGSFVCEYTGELLEDSEADGRINDEYMFDIGKNYNDASLWEGFSSFMPNMQNDTGEEIDGAGFAIDAAKYGSVGRFINHSCSPNLYAQNVLYDHDNKSMPHIMLFAAENIPPLKELTYHYNYTVDQVHDLDGNIKKKACNCGSAECSGWLY